MTRLLHRRVQNSQKQKQLLKIPSMHGVYVCGGGGGGVRGVSSFLHEHDAISTTFRDAFLVSVSLQGLARDACLVKL